MVVSDGWRILRRRAGNAASSRGQQTKGGRITAEVSLGVFLHIAERGAGSSVSGREHHDVGGILKRMNVLL